ncbi:TAXI family TRAP transporter solute-binding subunit [Pseudoclavibacter sp. VKM Ac-2888]|uniref:TAXI family TRAP transporter solute-binding subunit n=1 Tax=Pseudoclavibacter sp. VKM Ac-2888 TaxID=2783830 RepID=UPI00188AF59A|nr:TAXI family TRAP transporter solute-binding subunit [Pseudoclavibacter sp. VKM Ac-2888]MBF4551683.1 TAXI family TRAP transporter solute-binding subunit [Pseudoclavibacter sp. VKM Ac-2888]
MVTLTRRGLLFGAGAASAAAATFALAGCSLGQPSPRIRMACGEQGGTYVQFGELLREALRRDGTAGLDVVTTGGSVENLAMLQARDAELAIVLADAAATDAQNKVAIGRVYQNYLQCFVRSDGPVSAIGDLAGRRVSVGAPQSGAALTARRLLGTLGLLEGAGASVISELYLDEAVSALEAGTVDAIFWSGGLPLPAVQDLDTAVELVDLTDALPALELEHPGVYTLTAVPASTYGSAEAVPAIGVSNYLLARPDLPDQVARALVDVLIRDAAQLVPEGSLGVQYLTASNLIDTVPIALHPAAQRRYRELYG